MKSYLKIIILATSLLAVTGCSAKRVVVTENTETNTAVKLSEVQAKEHQEQSLKAEDIFSTATLSEDIELTQTRTLYSPPDSTGKQYPVEQTQTRLTNRKATQSSSKSITKTVVDVRDTTSTLANKSISQSDNQTRSTKENPRGQAWKSWMAIIISLVLAILCYLVLKRFGLVKANGGLLGRIFKNNRM